MEQFAKHFAKGCNNLQVKADSLSGWLAACAWTWLYDALRSILLTGNTIKMSVSEGADQKLFKQLAESSMLPKWLKQVCGVCYCQILPGL